MSISALPDSFRRIRLEQAREPKHPAGNSRDGHEVAVPLALDGRIDAETWRKHRDHSRVRRSCEEVFVPGEYVSVRNAGDEVHVYRAITVEPL